jgi:hypothetical protein
VAQHEEGGREAEERAAEEGESEDAEELMERERHGGGPVVMSEDARRRGRVTRSAGVTFVFFVLESFVTT